MKYQLYDTTSHNFPLNSLHCLSSGARPGQCPVTPVPELCVSHADECEFDGDCYPGKKCCSNTCFTRCLDPVRPSGSNSSDAESLAEGRAGIAIS